MARSRWAWVGGAGVAVVALGVLVAVNSSSERVAWTDEIPEDQFRDAHAEDPAIARAALARARARLTGAELPAAEALSGDGHGALWLCAYHPPSQPVCAAGAGADAASAVDAAMGDLTARGANPGARLKLDWPLARTPSSWPEDADRHAAGTVGIAVGSAVVLPSEILERDLLESDDEDEAPDWDDDAVRSLLVARGAQLDRSFAFDALRTASWVETGDGGIVRTYRLHAWDPPVLDAAGVAERARAAADALAGSVDPDGRILYQWDVSAGVEKKGSNLLRHAGLTFALLQAADRFDEPRYREAARRALTWLLQRTSVDERCGPYGGGRARHVDEGSHIKLGGAALALLALAQWQASTGDAGWSAEAKELATFLVAQQQQSGEFVYFAPKVPGGEPRDDTSAYYPGEAILALATWYALDPDPQWLDTARRGADWLIDVRDQGKGADRLDADHWLSYGLNALYATTKDARYVDHAERIAAAIAVQQARQAGHERYHRDYAGGFYEPPRSTPASIRAEALVAILDLCRASGRPCREVPPLLLRTLRHAAQSQYTADVAWWMPAQDRVIGAFAGGVVSPDTRNDFTQHALSALLGAERLGVLDTAEGAQ